MTTRLIQAAEEALRILKLAQEEQEGPMQMPWPEIEELEQAVSEVNTQLASTAARTREERDMLLELLKTVREWCDMPDVWDGQTDRVRSVLDAAIAKAEGGVPG
jgi:hypothetical protein